MQLCVWVCACAGTRVLICGTLRVESVLEFFERFLRLESEAYVSVLSFVRTTHPDVESLRVCVCVCLCTAATWAL